MAFEVPVKRIVTKQDLDEFLQSECYNEFINYIERLNDSVRNIKIDTELQLSPGVATMVEMLDRLSNWVDEIPPVENSKSRFGNPSFRDFYDRVKKESIPMMQKLIPDNDSNSENVSAAEEVATYFVESFGNRKRIDYGTGHEANFMAWLLCLEKLKVLSTADDSAVVLRIFVKYMTLMRKLQFEYWLEPAGSHGVWGLDDYHFLPFMFGSSQLLDHKHIRPKSIHDGDIVDEFSQSYMYLACIKFINTVKTTASLRWHSPMLDDISACKLWAKVNQGMIKMYKAEVMAKLPIMQHFMFGSLLKFEGGTAQAEEMMDECGHMHTPNVAGVYALGQEHPDCCGIPIPSAIAAAAEKPTARRIPFD